MSELMSAPVMTGIVIVSAVVVTLVVWVMYAVANKINDAFVIPVTLLIDEKVIIPALNYIKHAIGREATQPEMVKVPTDK